MAHPGTEPDDVLREHGKYQKVKSLGKGGFGFVELGRVVGTKEQSAIKFLKRGEMNKYVEAEIVNHSMLRHPHVIQFKEVFLTHEYICIAMEYANGGSLFQFVQKQGKLKEPVARWFFQQLMIGVDYCHKMGVANRDMKLENTLLQTVKGLPLPLLKICDFGYSKADFKSAAKSKVGTLTYMAPEVLVNRDGKYDGKIADIWSCGVMLYVMLCGRYPFDNPAGHNAPRATDIMQMLNNMINKRYTVPEGVDLSPEGRDLLDSVMRPDPKQRIQVEDIFKHPWYLTNLPPEAAMMNIKALKATPPPGYQNPQQIKALLNEVKKPSSTGAASGPGGSACDGLDKDIDAAMREQDELETSLDAAIRDDLQSGAQSTLVAEFLQANVKN